MRVEDSGGGEHDEVHDQVRKEHADQDVGASSTKLGAIDAAPLSLGELAGRAHLIDFRGRLPEEKVWRDRRPEDGHERSNELFVELQVRNDAGDHDLAEVRVDDESRDHVREKDERQPLEDLEDERVGQEELKRQDEHRHGHQQPDLGHEPARQH